MVFNSWQFLVFFPVVTGCYFVFTMKLRNPPWARFFLLAASLFFYGYWNPWYLGLILFSVGVSWAGALLLEDKTGALRKLILGLSVGLNLGVLFSFKYYPFFLETFQVIGSSLGGSGVTGKNLSPVQLLLPVGISFYTFQALGYLIDVYRGAVQAERSPLVYALFVTFFPQLVAGPIERTGHLLPQFKMPQGFDYERVTSGLRLAAWGMFKKVAIADRLAVYVNGVFNAPESYPAPALALGVLFFTFQIYGDFSGYSDIAVGAARILGFNLSINFRCPYFARSVRDFWRRWHISLSNWFKDYLYIPLGGSRTRRAPLNLLITFGISGLWHGAAWHFVFWGLLHGLFQIAERGVGRCTGAFRRRIGAFPPGTQNPGLLIKCLQGGLTFLLVSVAWIFFRANTLREGFLICARLGGLPAELSGRIRELPARGLVNTIRTAFQLGKTPQGVTSPIPGFGLTNAGISLGLVGILLIGGWLRKTGRLRIRRLPLAPRWAVYYALLAVVFLSWDAGSSLFIYFTF
ncbi:MAG: MBOAT family protein [Treponema sp.]|jgi:D-alanyl-lipoteichoic acid acyltransferase DltB (MBOAT superfamily)|nr:MBOAT family protein [Treponema sp.]